MVCSASIVFNFVRMIQVVLFFCICLHYSVSLSTDVPWLVQQYFSWRNVSNINIFTCDQFDSFKIIQFLSRNSGYPVRVGSGWEINSEDFESIMAVKYTKLGVFLDYDCNFTKNILFKSSESRMLNESYTWLIWSLQRNTLKEMAFLNLGLTSEVFLIIPGSILYSLYKVNYSSPLVTEISAKWNLSTGLQVNLNGSKVKLRSNFHGIQLRGTVVLTKLQTNSSNAQERILDNNFFPHLDSVSRFTFILYLDLQRLYNFTFNFEVTESWGYLKPQGGHDGMVGQLERGEIELGLTPATMFKHRMDTVDFTAPVWKFRTCFIFRHPDSFGIYKALVTPLTPTVWISTGILCVLIVSTLRLIHQFEVSRWPDTELSWSGSAILVVGALSQQGLASNSRRVSVRILSLFLLVLSVVLYAFYGAAIVTSLLTPPAKIISHFIEMFDIGLASNSRRVSVRILSLFLLVLSVVLYAFYGAAIVTSLLTPPAKIISHFIEMFDIGLASTSRRVSVRILSLFLLVLSVVLYAFYGAAIVTSLLTPPAKIISHFIEMFDIGLASTSRRVSVRILSLFLLLLSVVLYAFYGAAIVTSLLTPPAKSIHTIQQLLNSPIGVGVENTAYTRDYFSKSKDALTSELYKKKLQTPYGFMDVPNGIEMMRTQKYAFYAEDATLYLPIDKTFNNLEKCALTEIELFPPYLVSTPVQKMSPFRDFVSCGFNLMRERGILYRENKVWHPQRPSCIGDRQVARVDLESVMLAFLILSAGMVSSVIILIAERTIENIGTFY